MNKQNNIPKLPHQFFKWYCRAERYEELHGDLEEFFHYRVEEMGIARARWLYLWDVIRCCQPYAWRKSNTQITFFIMFRNFYFTAIRNLIKNKVYTLLNTSGLVIGLSSFIFIALYIASELSYDRFHSSYENIYRVKSAGYIRSQEVNEATSCSPLARTMLQDYPEIQQATRIRKNSPLLTGRGTREFSEDGVLFADSTFFDVFDFKLLAGNPETALVQPRSIILSKTYARKYFGYEDPMGKQITVEQDSILYTITGIMEDIPSNSHIQGHMIGSMSSNRAWDNDHWVGGDFYTYAIVDENANIEVLEEKLSEMIEKYMAPQIEYFTRLSFEEWQASGNNIYYDLFPLKDIHLHAKSGSELEANGNVSYIIIYSIVAVIMLFIAIFNFVNLATAQSSSRAREVGVKKVMGSSKKTLVYQFIFESIIVALIAAAVAVLLVYAGMPAFSELAGKELAFSITSSYWGILGVIVLALFTGILAGFYPAFVLSAFQPVEVLKGVSKKGTKSGWLWNFLVVVQFTASIVIIIGTLTVYGQIEFMLTKNLGFDKDQVLVIQRPDLIKTDMETFKNELLKDTDVKSVVNSLTIPGKNYEIRSYRPDGIAETHIFRNNLVSFGYEEMMGLELVSGRFFSSDYASDSSAVIINETAARSFGFENPVGEKLTSAFRSGEVLEIIGVIGDHNIESLHKAVEPVSLELIPGNNEGYILVKLSENTGDIRSAIANVESVWSIYSDRPFQYFFFDEEYQNLYQSETATGRIFAIFAALSILIACLGLIGLMAYSASVRKKEIGIRKVLGASMANVIRSLSGDVVRLIVIATVFSWPLAYLAGRYWLQNFANQLEISLWMYIGPTIAVILISSFAISFQTIKASMSNPIDSLRQE
ncbi:MAG: ABC transporter permease [Bacteroidota bacterium]